MSNNTTIIALTPAHTAGAVSVTVTNSDGENATTAKCFTYQSQSIPSLGRVFVIVDENHSYEGNRSKQMSLPSLAHHLPATATRNK